MIINFRRKKARGYLYVCKIKDISNADTMSKLDDNIILVNNVNYILSYKGVQRVSSIFKLLNIKNYFFEIYIKGGGCNSKHEIVLSLISMYFVNCDINNNNKSILRNYNRLLISYDSRKNEPKAEGCYGPRATVQKSYR